MVTRLLLLLPLMGAVVVKDHGASPKNAQTIDISGQGSVSFSGTTATVTVPAVLIDGGDVSGVGACGANTWASTLSALAAPTCTQPSYSSLSGNPSCGGNTPIGSDGGLLYCLTDVNAGVFTSTSASGANALAVTNAGARVDLGPGANDYAKSDGGVVTFASEVAIEGAIRPDGGVRFGDGTVQTTAGAAPGGCGANQYIYSTSASSGPQCTGLPVLAVTATAPIASSGGQSPNISITGVVQEANGGTGTSAPTDKSVLVGNGTDWVRVVLAECSPGTHLRYTGGGFVCD